MSLDLAEVKEVKQRLGGTVNDVVLATVAGAVRRLLRRRRVSLKGMEFRIAAPVSMRTPGDRTLGNRTSVWLTELPIGERDPRRRLTKICATTHALKQGNQALGTELLMRAADYAGPGAAALGARFATRMSPYNLLVTNVPGPQFPLYLLGARLLEAYPLPPLFENQGLGVALFSYDGRLYWGFNADWYLVPDLHLFVEEAEASFAELRQVAGLAHRRGRPSAPAASRRVAGGRRARVLS
jgi:WS/DGAT/MGAT family acyltransferase